MIKNRALISSVIIGSLVVSTASIASDNGPFNGWYGGGAFGYVQLIGKRSERVSRVDGTLIGVPGVPFVTLSHKNKLHDHNLQASLSIGYLSRFSQSRCAFAIEPFVSYTRLNARRKVISTVNPVLQVSTLERQACYGTTLRIGHIFAESSFLYGLTGVEISQFKYTNFDADNFTARARKNGAALILGGGIEKSFKSFRAGLEVRYSHYKKIRFSARDNDNARPLLFKATMQPRVIQAMLRFMVPFTALKGE